MPVLKDRVNSVIIAFLITNPFYKIHFRKISAGFFVSVFSVRGARRGANPTPNGITNASR